MSETMIPAGYLFKTVVARPEWLNAATQVADIYSVSACMSANFADYINHWKHNWHWLFDTPEIMRDIARLEKIDLSAMTLFYYEIYDQEFEEDDRNWAPFIELEQSNQVTAPASRTLVGYDVVSYSQSNAPECSPLSCNGVCKDVATNAHCLFDTFEDAKRALEDGAFNNSEPGPFRILAVYVVR